MTWDRGNTFSNSGHDPSFGEDLVFPEKYVAPVHENTSLDIKKMKGTLGLFILGIDFNNV